MKEWIANIFRHPDEQRFPIVWSSDQRAIYDFLAQWSDETSVLPYTAQMLPDEPAWQEVEETVRWSPGALDGVFSHHMANDGDQEKAAQVTQAIIRVLRRSSSKNMQAFYQLVKQDTPLGFIDDLLKMIGSSQAIDARCLRALVLFLVTQAP